MLNIKFSIIVPAYNVQEYLAECIESILNQSYDNYEIIIVNDGSTDKTLAICEEYIKENDKIKLINKENGGLSDARNAGMKYTSGEYIVFIDSDDYIHQDSLKYFADALKNKADVLITRLVEVYEDNHNLEMDEMMSKYVDTNSSKEQIIEWTFMRSQNTWPAPKYVISSKLIKDLGLEFEKGVLHEDLDWTTKLFCCAKSFSVCYLPWYFHRMGRANSITTTSNYKRAIDVIQMVNNHIQSIDNYEMKKREKDMIINRLVMSVYYILGQYKLASVEGKKAIIECVKDNRDILSYTPKIKFKIFVFAIKILGEKIALDLLALIN